MIQSRTWQKRKLQETEKDGYKDLYWFVQGELRGRLFPASHPGHKVPVVSIGPCLKESEEKIHLLIEIFKTMMELSSEKYLIHSFPQITDKQTLERQKFSWYEWGEEILTVDWICEVCGQVGRHECPVEEKAPFWVRQVWEIERWLKKKKEIGERESKFLPCIHGELYVRCKECSGG